MYSVPDMVLPPKLKFAVPVSTSSVPFTFTVVVPETVRLPRVVSVAPSKTVSAPDHVAPEPASMTVSLATVSDLPHSGSDGVIVIPLVVKQPDRSFVRKALLTMS